MSPVIRSPTGDTQFEDSSTRVSLKYGNDAREIGAEGFYSPLCPSFVHRDSRHGSMIPVVRSVVLAEAWDGNNSPSPLFVLDNPCRFAASRAGHSVPVRGLT